MFSLSHLAVDCVTPSSCEKPPSEALMLVEIYERQLL